MTKDNILDEILQQLIIETGGEPGYGRFKRETKAAILEHYISKEYVLAAIGEDEVVSGGDDVQVDFYNEEADTRNELRAQIRNKLGLGGSDD